MSALTDKVLRNWHNDGYGSKHNYFYRNADLLDSDVIDEDTVKLFLVEITNDFTKILETPIRHISLWSIENVRDNAYGTLLEVDYTNLMSDDYKANTMKVLSEMINRLDSLYAEVQELNWKDEQDREIKMQEFRQFQSDTTSKIDSLTAVYAKADSVLSSETIDVKVVDEPDKPNPAWTDGKIISLNKAVLDDITNLTDESLTVLNGINYHELAHILFSPRVNTKFAKWVMEKQYLATCQLLEDIRIETKLIAMYPSTKPFIESTFYRHVLNTNGLVSLRPELFARVYGAKYISLDIRQEIVNQHKQVLTAEVMQDIANLVNEYRLLSYPRDYQKGMDIIEKFSKYVALPQGNAQKEAVGCSNQPFNGKGRPIGQKEQDYATPTGENDELQLPTESDNTDTDNGNSPDNNTDSDSNNNTDSNEQRNKTKNSKLSDNAISEINKRMSELVSNSDVKQKNKDIRKSIANEDSVRNPLRKANHYKSLPNASYSSMATKFGHELERLRTDLDPMWEQETPSGRLNIQRAMKRDINSLDTLFDKWSEGSDACDIEAVILLDNSGSMMNTMQEVCQATWAMKRGIEKIQGDVTVLTFNGTARKLYEKHEKATHDFRAVESSGCTDPTEALRLAEQILVKSKRQTRLLLVVTDGYWSNDTTCNLTIQSMNDSGVISSLVYYGQTEYIQNRIRNAKHDANEERELQKFVKHNCTLFNAVDTPKDLLKVATMIVKERIKEVSRAS
jgi:hypothetical protein